jgi:hypothetical protein
MPNLTLKNLGQPLLEGLRAAAERNRRSLNSEAIRRLEDSLGMVPVEPEGLLARARVLREKARIPYLTDEILRHAREEGRA